MSLYIIAESLILIVYYYHCTKRLNFIMWVLLHYCVDKFMINNIRVLKVSLDLLVPLLQLFHVLKVSLDLLVPLLQLFQPFIPLLHNDYILALQIKHAQII